MCCVCVVYVGMCVILCVCVRAERIRSNRVFYIDYCILFERIWDIIRTIDSRRMNQ